MFLEVEVLGTDLARRRIGFYERAGFCLNDFDYIQPDLQQGQSSLLLKNMTYPKKSSKEDFERMKQQILRQCMRYKLKDPHRAHPPSIRLILSCDTL